MEKNKAAYDQYSERRDSGDLKGGDFWSWKDAIMRAQLRSGHSNLLYGHTDTSSTLWSIRHARRVVNWRPAYLGTLANWMSCTGNYPATSLWVHRCISEPALSRTSQVRHAGIEVCPFWRVCPYASAQQQQQLWLDQDVVYCTVLNI